MFKIKQIPEDFIVKEQLKLNLSKKGQYSYFLLKKRNLNTEQAVQFVAARLGINRKFINYAGNKDKNAVTEQFISINGDFLNNGEILYSLNQENLELKYLGRGNERINLGTLQGNEFEIIVRNLDEEDIEKFHQNEKNNNPIPNYFDEQRFSESNVVIGKKIIKKDFEGAINLIISSIDKKIKDKILEKDKNNFIGALNLVPKKILQMYVHAYQSYIFNETINLYLKNRIKKFSSLKYSLGEFIFPKESIEDCSIPIVGFGTEIEQTILKEIIHFLLDKEEIIFRDFVIRKIPRLSQEGAERNLLINVKGFSFENIDCDELNAGRKKMLLKFSLGKGSYATIVIKALFS